MIAKQLLPALAAAVGLASAQGNPCSQANFTINSQADITNLGSCSTLTGNVVVGTQTDNSLDFTGITTIAGDFIVLNNKGISSLKSSTLTQITGNFQLQNLTSLINLQMTSLTSCGSITFITLNQLDSLNFGTVGVTTAGSVTVSDTFLKNLVGLNMQAVNTLDINNNHRITQWTSPVANISNRLNINANGVNGVNLAVSFPNLVWCNLMTISNLTSLSMPSLVNVNNSMQITSNYFSTFAAPNVTSLNDTAFVSNAQLTNISFPQLTLISGGFQIANNTALQKINGFPKLQEVDGAIKFRGSFNDVELPSLNVVKGAFDVSSTGDISSSCNAFQKLAPSTQGGNNDIQGSYSCTSNNANANSDTSSPGSGTGSNGNSAVGLAVNMAAVLGLSAAGILLQAML